MKNNIFKPHNSYEVSKTLTLINKDINHFTVTDFPEMIKNNMLLTQKSNILETKFSFIDKLKTVKDIKKEPVDVIKPGWTYIYKDEVTKKTIFLEGPSTIIEKEDKYSILDALVSLHENRKKMYNKQWGNGEYERMFYIPNYDYEYFDQLDEIYEEENNNSVEYNSDDDYYDNNIY